MTTIYTDKPLPKRRKFDYYKTEDLALIRGAVAEYGHHPAGDLVLDPGAGDGRWGQEVKRLYPSASIHGVEKRRVPRPEGFDLWRARKNFLTFQPRRELGILIRYGLAVGNPPYDLAEEFIRHTWSLLANGGRIVFLLPLQFQVGVGRYNGLWTELPPTLVAGVCPRPSFGKNRHGRRGTNGTDYGLFVWNKGLDGYPVGTARAWPFELFIYQPSRGE